MRCVTAALLLCFGLCWQGLARAHDPPLGTGVFEHAGQLLVRTNRGLLLSRDPSNRTFGLLCNEALGIDVYEVPAVMARADGRWLVGSSRGLVLLAEDGCSLEPLQPLAAVSVSALEPDPFLADHVWAASAQGLYASADGGQTFHTEAAPAYVALAASPATRDVLYAVRKQARGAAWDLFVARADDARTFSEHHFELTEHEYGVDLLGAHATRAHTVFAAAHAYLGTNYQDRFLVSTDGAGTWTEVSSANLIGGFAMSADGGSLWLGAADGLRRSADLGQTWTQLGTAPISCLVRRGDSLIACDGLGASGGISRSDDAGATFASILRFEQVRVRLDCAASDSVPMQCANAWRDWELEIPLASSTPDGTVWADAGTGQGAASMTASGCSSAACTVPGRRSLTLSWASWVLLLVARLGRRRVKRRYP